LGGLALEALLDAHFERGGLALETLLDTHFGYN
jgi:hypothetical protein